MAFLIAVIGVFKQMGYPPGLLAGIYLLAYCLGRLSAKGWQTVLNFLLVAALILAADSGRGTSIMLLLAFTIGRGRIDSYGLVLLPVAIGVALILLTQAKFYGDDISISANLFDRISNFNQFKLYLLGVGEDFSAGRPVAADLITSFPIIRSFFSQLDEALIFYRLTGGSVGGMAIGPELRSLAYWGDSAWIYADLAIAYALLYSVITFLVRNLAYGGEFLVIPFFLLISFDSLNSGATFVQIIVIIRLIIAFFRFFTSHYRPKRPAT